MQAHNHKHLLAKAHFDGEITRDIPFLTEWMRNLVDKINMKILVEPNLVFCPTAGNEGITGTMVIETSHCAFHIFEDANFMAFDLYSCRDFVVADVIAHIRQIPNVGQVEWCLIDRNEDFKVVVSD
jgi:S-adenosylmethionine/arginine decarboxylase-like enzyme